MGVLGKVGWMVLCTLVKRDVGLSFTVIIAVSQLKRMGWLTRVVAQPHFCYKIPSVGIKEPVTAETRHSNLVFDAFIGCIERKNEVFCSYSTDSVACCVLH